LLYVALRLVFFIVGNWKDMGDPGGFDEEASSLILLGPGSRLGSQMITFYKDEDFDKGGVDEEYNQFTVLDSPVLGSPLGVLVVPDFNAFNYETDPGGDTLNDSADSVRFGGVN